MFKLRSIPLKFIVAGAAAAVIIVAGTLSSYDRSGADRGELAVGAAHAEDAKQVSRWAASATGRIEPSSGLIRLTPETSGRILDVLAKTNDKVFAGDLLIVLDSGDILDKLTAARSVADVRERDRENKAHKGLAKDRQEAQDAEALARRDLFSARQEFDSVYMTFAKDAGSSYAVTTARDAISRAHTELATARENLKNLNADPDMPLMTRLESALASARADVASAEHAFERSRIRAPFDGTVLNVYANAGDMASPASVQPLIAFGDVAKLRVRAEVEERDIANVRVGQKIVVRADAFPDQEFVGTVSEIASALGPPRIATRGPRRPNDVDVLEVVAQIDGTPRLITGMRVDVFFKRVEGDATNSKK